MPECVVNIYQIYVSEIGNRTPVLFNNPKFNSIKVVDDELSKLRNGVSDVFVKRGDGWMATKQSIFLVDPKKDVAKGIFYGNAEVGSHSSFDRLRNRSGKVPYIPGSDDFAMRDFFYRIEMPPDSALGFLVVQRHGRNTAAHAIQQAMRRKFFQRDRAIVFRLITDKEAFNEYLNGRVQAIRATYVPQKEERRNTIKKAIALGSGLSSETRDDMSIDLKVDRPITAILRQKIVEWLTSGDESKAPQIVTLPVDDDPDKIVLSIETESGKQKQLHPGMIEEMALTVDLSGKIKGNSPAAILSSTNDAAATVCLSHRTALMKTN